MIDKDKFLYSPQKNKKIIAIAASTGGTDAIETVLKAIPKDCPPILIVQHMISGFTKLFAKRLNDVCLMEVREAKDGDSVSCGLALIAPADYHMAINKTKDGLCVNCYIGKKIHGVMPAADILFDSVANTIKEESIGVVLTGMGHDGANGILNMHKNGAKTICQDKETCVVYGMPKSAKDCGAIDFELPINLIADKIIKLL